MDVEGDDIGHEMEKRRQKKEMEEKKENEGEKGRKRGCRPKYGATMIMEEMKIKRKGDQGLNRGLGFNKINERSRSILKPRFILGLGLSFLSS